MHVQLREVHGLQVVHQIEQDSVQGAHRVGIQVNGQVGGRHGNRVQGAATIPVDFAAIAPVALQPSATTMQAPLGSIPLGMRQPSR